MKRKKQIKQLKFERNSERRWADHYFRLWQQADKELEATKARLGKYEKTSTLAQ